MLAAHRVVVAQWDRDAASPTVVAWPRADTNLDVMAPALQGARQGPPGLITVLQTDDSEVLVAALDAAATSAIALQLDPGRSVRPEDRELFAALISHLAPALLTVRDLEKTRAVALTLQHAMLGPTMLPHGFAVRYSPAEEPLQVGGDWYDVIPLGGDRVGVIVGDCVGHGLPAAAVMGQLRSAARALMLRDPSPAQVLESLDGFARAASDAQCTTVFCGVIDTVGAAITYSSAGHLPPIIVSADGHEELLDGARSVPLAVTSSGPPRTETDAPLPAGATLLLYTDGLVERRGEPLDVGIARAGTALIRHRHLDPQGVCDHVMRLLTPLDGYADDVAMLLYRQPPEALHLEVPALPAVLADLRTRLRNWLTSAGVGSDTIGDTTLAVGEATANTIEHGANMCAHHVTLTLSAHLSGSTLTVAVADDGCWRPPPALPGNRGHGLNLMRALMDSTQVNAAASGTTVVMTKNLVAVRDS
ncbi:MAG: SpoIIE family protein phosphatase [Mycobacteriaceae bacterium]|nr:SpoIIE family protein phosphatase [Mycobacteriaceae bacterium]